MDPPGRPLSVRHTYLSRCLRELILRDFHDDSDHSLRVIFLMLLPAMYSFMATVLSLGKLHHRFAFSFIPLLLKKVAVCNLAVFTELSPLTSCAGDIRVFKMWWCFKYAWPTRVVRNLSVSDADSLSPMRFRTAS